MNLSEINWDFDAAGTWPLPIKIATVVITCVLVAGLGIYFDTQDQLKDLETVEKKEQQLKTSFETKFGKVVNLDAYKQQLQEIQESFGTMLRQLPNRTEVANLLVEVSQTGLASGLEFELFKPRGEVQREFYAELPIDVRVIGEYEEIGLFVSGLASLPRIVTIHNVTISPKKIAKNAKNEKPQLVMNAVVKTYRYLESGGQIKKKKGKRRARR